MGVQRAVTIVTPAYNAAAHLAETARSVLAQSFTDWEWIIVDDGSTDTTREIVAGLDDPRITLIAAEHSGLPAVARNLALRRSSGTYIAFLDADDVWLPEKLSLQIAYLESRPEVGLVFSRSCYFFEEFKRLRERHEPRARDVANPGMMFVYLGLFGNRIATSSIVVRRGLLDAHGLMDEDPRQRGTEDYEWLLRLAPHAQFGWVDRPLVWYRISAQSLSARAGDIAQGKILALEKALARHSGPPLHPRLTGRALEAHKFFWMGMGELVDRVGDCGRRNLWRSVRLDPTNTTHWRWWLLSHLGPTILWRLRRLAHRML